MIGRERTSKNLSELAGVLFRSLLIQASWNYQGMQNLGFATMTIPPLRRGDGGIQEEEALAQLDFFNTHPYLAPAIAALTLGLKVQKKRGKSFLEAQREAKETWMGPLGALGDDFFWASLRPLTAILGVLATMAGRPLLGIILFLFLFNFYHFRVQWKVITNGFSGSERLTRYLEKENLNGQAEKLKKITGVVMVFLPFFWAHWWMLPWEMPFWVLFLIGLMLLLVFRQLLKKIDQGKLIIAAVGVLTMTFYIARHAFS